MSVKISGLVWDANIPRDEKFLLLAYADHAAHDGSDVYPSKETIERMTGYSRRSVQVITAKVLEEGLLIPDGTSELRTTRYRFNLAKLRQLSTATEGAESAPSAESALRKTPPKRAQILRPIRPPSEEPPEDMFGDVDGNPPEPAVSFDAFYRLYPRKTGKGAAERAWRGKAVQERIDYILPALQAQLRAGMFQKEKQYIPHPATWLNRKQWEDEIIHENHGTTNGKSSRATGQIGVGRGRYDRSAP